VAASAGEVDLAMVFGTGFPPFRGGPLRYADTVGLSKVHSRLVALYADKGERFKPAALLVKMTEEGKTFTQPIVI
jgi:3-hydroxyacyl-CoA dehydrogenase